MKPFTATWTTTIAAAALLALPLAGHARPGQTPSEPTSAQAGQLAEDGVEQRQLAQEHLRKADAALGEIPAASLPADAQTRVADLKRRISALQHSDRAAHDRAIDAAAPDAAAAAAADNRRTELAAIERTLTELLGEDGAATGAPAVPGDVPVGTSGAPAAALDEATRTTLQQVRTHITAYAGAMGSVDRPDATADTPPAADPSAAPSSASAPPSAESATAATSPTDPTPTPTGTSPTAAPQTPGAPDAIEARAARGAPQHADAESARLHLTAARNVLSRVTQLPAAAEITGESRTQLSQLISHFNELIATDDAWQTSLDKVKASLKGLLSDAPGEVATAGADPAAPAEEPAGTTGVTPLDPRIRAHLVEFRTHLRAFETAATGAPETGSGVSSSEADTASRPPTTPAPPGGVATRASETDPTTASGSTSTGSEIGGMPGRPTDTTDTTAATTPPPDTAVPDEALRHIEAIQSILGRGGQPEVEATGTSGERGATASHASGAMLDAADVAEIRRHLNELRRLVESRGQ